MQIPRCRTETKKSLPMRRVRSLSRVGAASGSSGRSSSTPGVDQSSSGPRGCKSRFVFLLRSLRSLPPKKCASAER